MRAAAASRARRRKEHATHELVLGGLLLVPLGLALAGREVLQFCPEGCVVVRLEGGFGGGHACVGGVGLEQGRVDACGSARGWRIWLESRAGVVTGD